MTVKKLWSIEKTLAIDFWLLISWFIITFIIFTTFTIHDSNIALIIFMSTITPIIVFITCAVDKMERGWDDPKLTKGETRGKEE